MDNQWEGLKGFRDVWEPAVPDEGIMVVELRHDLYNDGDSLNEISKRLEKIRYNVLTNKNNYDSGDNRSWQRYTPIKPVKISPVTVRSTTLSFTIEGNLEDDRVYAILLLHGSLSEFQTDTIRPKLDDYLIPFRFEPMNEKPVENTDQNLSECVICMENPKDFLCIPCGHRALCGQCSQRILDEPISMCPVCRKKVDDIIKIYDC